MANSYHRIYIQAVFAVKYRRAAIHNAWKAQLFAVIGNLINEQGCKTFIVNGVEDHVHCFFGLKPSVSISHVMKNIKAKSSKWVNDNKLVKDRFEWQKGYGVFSYSRSHLDNVYQYIENQEEHHKQHTFRNEYVDFLRRFGIQYDEQYIFKDMI